MRRYGDGIRFIAVLVMLVTLGGCAATPMTDQLTASPPQGLPAVAELSEVPFFAQTEYFCGPAALATVLNTTGLETRPDSLAGTIYTPGRQGTLQTEILTGTRRHGRLALPVHGMSEAFMHVAHGRPVLILQNLALEFAPQWHYAVLVGFDLSAKTVLLRSGQTRRLVMPMTTFEHTWRRAEFWGVAVVGPQGPVPENTSIASWLHEALGLERAGNAADALTAYVVAARHWPAAPAPLIAAANIWAGQRRLQDAAASLRAAVIRQPDNAVALNNLAHILMQQGELDAAERTALKAIQHGGDIEAVARETLAAIRAKQAN